MTSPLAQLRGWEATACCNWNTLRPAAMALQQQGVLSVLRPGRDTAYGSLNPSSIGGRAGNRTGMPAMRAFCTRMLQQRHDCTGQLDPLRTACLLLRPPNLLSGRPLSQNGMEVQKGRRQHSLLLPIPQTAAGEQAGTNLKALAQAHGVGATPGGTSHFYSQAHQEASCCQPPSA